MKKRLKLLINFKILILGLLLCTFIQQDLFAMTSNEAKDVTSIHYKNFIQQNFNPLVNNNFSKTLYLYKKDPNFEINKKIIQKYGKTTYDNYNIWVNYVDYVGGKIAFYNIWYHNTFMHLSYDINGNLIMITLGFISDKDNYVYAYSYAYPSKKLAYVTLYADEISFLYADKNNAFRFIPINGNLVEF